MVARCATPNPLNASVPHEQVYPFITLAFAVPFSPLLVKAAIDKVRGRKLLPSIPPSEAVAAALSDERYGTHQYIKANGITFHYVETGAAYKGQGCAILFLHGFPEVRLTIMFAKQTHATQA